MVPRNRHYREDEHVLIFPTRVVQVVCDIVDLYHYYCCNTTTYCCRGKIPGTIIAVRNVLHITHAVLSTHRSSPSTPSVRVESSSQRDRYKLCCGGHKPIGRTADKNGYQNPIYGGPQ